MGEGSLTQPLRVLPLGDSITQVFADSSYRYPLWQRFINHGIEIDYLGTLDDTADLSSPDRPVMYRGRSYDGNHEGHWGWSADEIFHELPNWLDTYETPDLTLIHLGTNDSFRREDNVQTAYEIGVIIRLLKDRNPNMIIAVARIFPGFWGDVTPLNDEISSLEAPGVFIADCHTGMNLDEDSFDNAHPNASGGEKIAAAWWEAIVSQLEPWRQSYRRWTQLYEAELIWDQDPDGDGWINFLEYTTHSNPLDVSDAPGMQWIDNEWRVSGFDELRAGDHVILESAATPSGPFFEGGRKGLGPLFFRWKLVSIPDPLDLR